MHLCSAHHTQESRDRKRNSLQPPDVTTFLTRQLLTDFEEIIPGFDKLLPEGQVGPHALGEEDDQRGEPEHLPHGEDELLRFLGHLFVQAAHTVLEQDRADACVRG